MQGRGECTTTRHTPHLRGDLPRSSQSQCVSPPRSSRQRNAIVPQGPTEIVAEQLAIEGHSATVDFRTPCDERKELS